MMGFWVKLHTYTPLPGPGPSISMTHSSKAVVLEEHKQRLRRTDGAAVNDALGMPLMNAPFLTTAPEHRHTQAMAISRSHEATSSGVIHVPSRPRGNGSLPVGVDSLASSPMPTAPDRLRIFVDWPHPRQLWGHNTYKAIEALISHYPDASIRLMVVAPDMYVSYHFADVPGMTILQKYKKRGYDVGIKHITHSHMLRHLGPDLPGIGWWNQIGPRCCGAKINPP